MNNGNLISFQPDLIQATQVKGTSNAADTLGLGVLMRESKPYLRWVIGNEIARKLGLRAGSRVSFGISEDGQAAVIAPSPGTGWKLVKQGPHALTVMVIASKLGLTELQEQPLAPADFIRYDSQLIVDLTPLNA